MRSSLTTLILVIIVCCPVMGENRDSTHISFSGQATAWGVAQYNQPIATEWGARFVPTLLGNFKLSSTTKLDFEASVNINGKIDLTGFRKDTVSGEFKPYRVWLRTSGDNWEVRAGLQKINFGTAKLFRPLMWFDALDVRDPLQLTDGVYGVLGKYFFKDNANIWLWGLIGNNRKKGFEILPTASWQPEYGGRFEMPVGPGEMGLSSHFRKTELNIVLAKQEKVMLNESRVGLDGKWDVGIGLWFESSIVLSQHKINSFTLSFIPRVQDLWNLGADYTIPIGNGVGITAEYFRYHAGEQVVTSKNSLATLNVLGTMLTYPVSLLDNLSGMVFYLPDQHTWMNYLSWARTYDNLSLYAIGYWNPDNINLMSAQAQSHNLFAGKGIQIIVNYNF